jgi:hypothetical protein
MAVGGAGGPVVLDVKTEVAVDGDRNSDLVGLGVAGDIGQGLGDDPVGGHLDRRWQRRQGRRCLQGD